MRGSDNIMSDTNLGLFKEWRVADRQAHALEQALSRASLAALQGHGEPPAREERERAQTLRHTADDLFQLAMRELEAGAAAARA